MNKNQLQFLDGFEPKSEYPELENIQTRRVYAFTVSPEPEAEYRVPSAVRKLVNEILPLFCADCKLWVELSTKNQIVHFHGYISFAMLRHIGRFYLNIKAINQLCHFKIDVLNNPENWYPYITKQRPVMDTLLHNYQLDNPIRFAFSNKERKKMAHKLRDVDIKKSNQIVMEQMLKELDAGIELNETNSKKQNTNIIV